MNWDGLKREPRLLMEAQLVPVQGSRFQPTGFPDIGAAEYRTPEGKDMLLVESAQSIANRLEAACWDEAKNDLIAPLQGLPFVRVALPDGRKTSSVQEAHRLNSAYIMRNAKGIGALPALAELENDPGNTRRLAAAAFRYDPGSVIHGVFLEKVGGGLRLRRALSGFIEAEGVSPADSGGLKADMVDPSGKKLGSGAGEGYGHVPFHRREYTGRITAFFNLDLAQIRAYGLGEDAERLLTALSLYKVRRFLHDGLRLRTACDLRLDGPVKVTAPAQWELPDLAPLEQTLPGLVKACGSAFADPRVTELEWSGNGKGRSKAKKKADEDEDSEDDTAEE